MVRLSLIHILKQRLAVMHRIFCDAISRNLGIAYDPELPLFRGQDVYKRQEKFNV